MMKSWRPEKFSDTSTVIERPLGRTLFEYHLDTLTARNQDTEFELFALEVCRQAICPNLRSQTGPTGGGDAKVDFENYPVADQLTLAWYVGEGNAARERWGFAVSAKKDWKPKLISDIAKIAGTGRNYRKAFFISNQFISDKKAADLEDELRKKHSLEVRILSRNWLIDETWTRKLDSMAIDVLGIEVGEKTVVQQGPLDMTRTERLAAIDKEIEDAVREGRLTYELVDQSLTSAKISRELERPRPEVEGRYIRAADLAEKCGSAHQSLIAVYQRAWTAFFWYEDFALFDQLYSKVEEMAKTSDNACHLELLKNLWNLAFTLGRLKSGSVGSDKLPTRTITLADQLTKLSNEPDRPTAALHARSMLLMQQITATLPNTSSTAFAELREVLRSCSGLVGFPLKPLVQNIEQLESLIEDEAEFDLLFEEMVSVTSKQAGEVEGAMVIMRRGAQRLEKGNYYDAIALIGRALGDLAKHETRHYLILGLNLIAHAYEKVGFLWAARGAALNSVTLIINEYNSYADSSRLVSGPISRLKWLELQIGRFPQCIEWAQVDAAVMASFGVRMSDDEEKLEESQTLDLGLAILVLRTNPDQLLLLKKFPDVLERLGLDCTKGALLFLYGHDDDFHKQFATDDQNVSEFYEKLLSQPIAEDVSKAMGIDQSDKVVLHSRIWGCSIQVSCPAESPFQELAESILAAMEAILATAGRYRMMGMSSVIVISIVEAPCDSFEFDVNQSITGASFEIRCGRFDAGSLSQSEQFQIRDKICELTVSILARFFYVKDFDLMAERLFQDECAFDRGVNLTTSFVTLANVLGRSPRTRLSDWLQGDEVEYVNLRSQPWRPSETVSSPATSGQRPEEPSASVRPDTWEGFGEIDQRQIRTLSLIDIALWDSAKWKGTAFMWDEDHKQPPLLGILFENSKHAAKIFAQWRQELGSNDVDDRLRVIIVKGINRNNPFAYRVCLTSNIRSMPETASGSYFMIMNRCNTMEPENDHNLSSFIALFHRFRHYWLIYATLAPDGHSIDPVLSSSILKKQIVIREAWEIGINDEDCMAIQPDDEPFIPPNTVKPPILGLQNWLRQKQ